MSVTHGSGEVTACPGCGSPSSENYGDDGACWSCYAASHPEVVTPSRSRHKPDSAPPLGDEPAAPSSRTTWTPIPLDAVLNGEDGEQRPSMLARTDGHYLLYPGRIHAVHAEPEALKTWLALKACAERIAAGETVIYVDFEDSPANVVKRLLGLGTAASTIAAGFVYIRPDEPLTPAAMHDLDQALSAGPTLAVIDGVTEAFSRQGLNPLDNSDVATWLDLLPRKFARAGMAALTLDHVVKDREQRGRYAIGAQHKLAGVDVAYSMRPIEPFARGREGLVAIKVEKDRPGRIREFAPDGQVALLRARSLPDGGVRIELEPPERGESTFRPTVLMERISCAVEADPGLSKRALRAAVRGQTKASDLALELLIAEGFIEARRDGSAHQHFSTRPFREAEDQHRDPVTAPCPERDQSHGCEHRDPVTPPYGVPVTGHGASDTRSNGRPDPDDDRTDEELQRLIDSDPGLPDDWHTSEDEDLVMAEKDIEF